MITGTFIEMKEPEKWISGKIQKIKDNGRYINPAYVDYVEALSEERRKAVRWLENNLAESEAKVLSIAEQEIEQLRGENKVMGENFDSMGKCIASQTSALMAAEKLALAFARLQALVKEQAEAIMIANEGTMDGSETEKWDIAVSKSKAILIEQTKKGKEL